jgi:hypothetical protein
MDLLRGRGCQRERSGKEQQGAFSHLGYSLLFLAANKSSTNLNRE